METLVWLILDIVLIATLLALGWASLVSEDTRRAVVFFIGFGLMLALIWVRLRAPDIALAEAAIGAGLTGALFLAALRDEPNNTPDPANDAPIKVNRTRQTLLLSALSLGLTVVMGFAFFHALKNSDSVRLAADVFANLHNSGVSNPVTGVLLNFRAYDTLLELAVLLAAVLAVIALGPSRAGSLAAGPVFSRLVGWLVPVIILVSGYLLWAGAHAPGGAFQAGALLAATGVLLRLSGHPTGGLPVGTIGRVLFVVGVALFLTIGLSMTFSERAFLEYPVNWAGSLILAIETAATLAIAATLVTSYLCGDPEQTPGN